MASHQRCKSMFAYYLNVSWICLINFNTPQFSLRPWLWLCASSKSFCKFGTLVDFIANFKRMILKTLSAHALAVADIAQVCSHTYICFCMFLLLYIFRVIQLQSLIHYGRYIHFRPTGEFANDSDTPLPCVHMD